MVNENKKGRPRKFSTEDLKEIIELYLLKNKNTPTLLTTTKLAKYATTLGKKAHYQDFSRNKEVSEYISEINTKIKSKLLKNENINRTPIHSTMNVDKFLAKNNTPEKIKKALIELDSSREKTVIEYGILESKYLNQSQKIIELKSEISKLKEEINTLNNTEQSKVKDIKVKLKNSQLRNKVLREKVFIYEHFINKYHMDVISQQALAIEGIIQSEVEIDNHIFDTKQYKSNSYDLSTIIKSYNDLLEGVSKINFEDGLEFDNENSLDHDDLNFEDDESINDDLYDDSMDSDGVSIIGEDISSDKLDDDFENLFD